MAGHTWTSLHGDMPMRGMNDEVEPPATEGEMPTRLMTAAEAHVPRRAPSAAKEEIDAELAMYQQRKQQGS